MLLPSDERVVLCFLDSMMRLRAHMSKADQFALMLDVFHALFKKGSLVPIASKIQQMMRSHRRTPTQRETERLRATSAIDTDASANGIQCAVTVSENREEKRE